MKKIDELIEQVRLLPDSSFHYEEMVKNGLQENCGTVGCLLNFYPIWFPDAGLKHAQNRWTGGWAVFPDEVVVGNTTTVKALATYHDIPNGLVLAIFYGDQALQQEWGLPACYLSSTSKQQILLLLKAVKKKLTL